MNIFNWLFASGMLTQTFMIHAFLAGTAIAVMSAFIGLFVVLRKWTFVAHALPKIGFAGASGAVLLAQSPLLGVVVFSIGGAVAIGNLQRRGRADAMIALTLVLALGVGGLFLSWSNNFAQNTYGLLFGQVVGISGAQVWWTLIMSAVCILAVLLLYRPLLLTTLRSDWAQSRGIHSGVVDVLFLLVAGVAASLTVPLVGVLLNFSLIVAPTAAAMKLAKRPHSVLFWSLGISVFSIWISLVLAYHIGWPVSFFVTTVTTVIYLLSIAIQRYWLEG